MAWGTMPFVEGERVVGPRAVKGFTAAVVVNVTAATAFWVAGASEYGFSDGDDVSMHLDEWVRPTALFLAIAVLAGVLSLAVRGWGRFGVGLITGAATVAALDLAWTFIYLVSQGS